MALFYGSWLDFQTYYFGVMKDLNSYETKAYMRDKINRSYTRARASEESFTRYSKPQQILNQGKGKCGEFAIVYVAACLALGYEARIVACRQFYLIFVYGFHAWAEVKLDGVWTHVDPSPTAFWNDTSRYRSWNWEPRITLNVFAFEDGKMKM